ncbi:hypothetical protein EXIGLDRAFT_261375 [Exidia glandulosa HHB12029]|uniref:Uncharacterized protein n=1 Tax=Exidia glandulosa HHB12029 TaxID=1314781 RepID=A0A165DU89_EXIGL|nr:hypothetical protein EXIGLDRAFT_261375 [Exidia glandulosa HHB12029]
MRTPKRKVALLRSWLARSSKPNDDQNRDPQEQDVMQLEDEDHVVVASMEGMPTQADLRAMSVEKMQDVLRAINKRLPEAMRVEVEEPAEGSKLRALLEDVLGYSSSTLAPRRPSLSICPSTPTSPLTKDCTNTPSHLAAPASSSPMPLKSPSFVFRPSPGVAVLRPIFAHAQRRSTRSPRHHGATHSACSYPRPAAERARGATACARVTDARSFRDAYVGRPCRDDDCDAGAHEEEDVGPGGGRSSR